MKTDGLTRAAASRKAWRSRRAMQAARAAMTDADAPPIPAPERGSAVLAAEDMHPGELMRRALDGIRAKEAAE